MNKAGIIGYSGHSYVIIDILMQAGYEMAGYFEKQEKGFNPFSLAYLGDESVISAITYSGCGFIIGIGNNKIRARIYNEMLPSGFKFINAIHETVVLGKHSSIGKGNLVAAGGLINPLAVIGDNCIINTGAILEHNCRIGDHVHIAPGAVLAGDVVVGSFSFIGANAVIKEGVTIGDNVTIGAGSVVLKDVEGGTTWVGNPAKRIK